MSETCLAEVFSGHSGLADFASKYMQSPLCEFSFHHCPKSWVCHSITLSVEPKVKPQLCDYFDSQSLLK